MMTRSCCGSSRPVALFVVLTGLMASGTALAHHPMGGRVPETQMEGLLSGLGHPIIGVDHLAFIIGVGVAFAFGLFRNPFAPFLLLLGAVAGTVVHWSTGALPFVELLVAFSLLGAAAIVVVKPQAAWSITIAGTLAAFLHGQAYGGAIIGAEATPLGAYLIGFTAVQIAIATLACVIVRRFLQTRDSQGWLLRAGTGGALASVGVVHVALASIV